MYKKIILICMLGFLFTSNLSLGETMAPLTNEEARIIINKGTEAPYSGKLLNNKKSGIYACRQCGKALYRSEDKFDSRCGWPSFDDAITGAVQRTTDADGRRVEITCVACGGHLGHVFEGEGFTEKNTRHCVNSVSMSFLPREEIGYAYFAGGCFWGVENEFEKLEGVLDVSSGYMGGTTENPSYEEVSTGKTGHAETVQVMYELGKIDYETLARLFFEIHDPSQEDRQGPDVGTQYRSAIFYTDEAQKTIAENLMSLLMKNGWAVATELSPAEEFYAAEDYHQNFTARTGRGACHFKVKRFEQKGQIR